LPKRFKRLLINPNPIQTRITPTHFVKLYT
jgi:hypothetical protein